MTEIEILPWVHDAQTTGHADLVEYLGSLPKNSTILLEGTQQAFDVVTASLEHFSGGKISENNLTGRTKQVVQRIRSGARSMAQLGESFIAAAEILHVCESRNIKVIPLDPDVSDYPTARKNRGASVPKHSREFVRYSDEREKRMVQRVRSTIYTTRQAKIPCIVGYGHAISLVEKLVMASIPARINTSFFRNKKMETAIYYKWLAKTAAMEGRTNDARRLIQEYTEIDGFGLKDSGQRASRIISQKQAKRRKFQNKRRQLK